MRFRLIPAAIAIFWLVTQAAPRGQDGHALVTAAADAMGAGALRTVTLTGSGSQGRVGQNVSPTAPWPQVPFKTYTRSVDVEAGSTTLDAVRLQNGTESPLSDAVPANAPWERRYQAWVTTPYVFLKAAMANPVTVRAETIDGVPYNVITLRVDNKYTVSGYLSAANLVERVRTTVDNDVLGDMPVEGVFTDYKTMGGLKVPALTIVKEGGFATLIAGVADAKVNAPLPAPRATSAASAAAPATAPVAAAAAAVATEKLVEGVTVLRGGSHHSVLVEFADHLTLIEAPQNEARSVALLAAIKKLYPAKPLTQVVNTHHHFDHAGGLRTFVDAGATVLTHELNQPFYQATFTAARTLSPDRLARSKRAATITAVGDRLVLSDATRTIELHHLTGSAHDEGMLVAFLPKEKLLIEADMYTPPAAQAAPAALPASDAPVNPNAVTLVENVERLRLDYDTIVPLHGAATVPRASLYEFIRKPVVPVSALPTVPAGRGGRGGRPPLAPIPAQPAPPPGGAQP